MDKEDVALLEGEDVALATFVVSRDTGLVTAEKERTDLREMNWAAPTGLHD